MPVTAKMTCQEVMARGGGTLIPLCAGYDLLDAWPPPREKVQRIGIYGHGPEDCEHCAEAHRWLSTHYDDVEDAESIFLDGKGSEAIKLMAVASGNGADDPNAKWAAATPAGELTMTIDNPRAWGFFDPGEDYIVEIRKHVPNRGKRDGSNE